MERHGAAHRIKSTRSQDQSSHQQSRRNLPPAGRRQIGATWDAASNQWLRDTGEPYNADELEQLGIDPTLRQM